MNDNPYTGVVECMAAGLVMLAHNSGGPRADIIIPHQGDKTGFLASDENSYSEALTDIFCMTEEERLRLKQNAKNSVLRFSDAQFERSFVTHLHPLIEPL